MERPNLTDAQFKRIEHLLPGRPGSVGKPAKDNRKFVHAVLWIGKTGVPWRDLPSYFGKWNSVFKRYDSWCRKGTWSAIMAALSTDADTEALAIDSTAVRAHQNAAGAEKKGFRPSKAGIPRRWAVRVAA
jgi:transposase